MSDAIEITFVVPPAGEKPSIFRRNVRERIRDAVAHAHLDGRIDSARAEEIYRAVPVGELEP